jgi:8-oxo-dGTP diphosphatase
MTASAPEQPDVVAGILIREGHVLLCRRAASTRWYPGVWDFPGHVQAGESYASALVRELREELGVVVTEPVTESLFRVCAEDFDLRIWLVTEWAGTPSNAAPDEHDDVAWFSVSEAVLLSLAHPGYPSLIVNALKIAGPLTES